MRSPLTNAMTRTPSQLPISATAMPRRRTARAGAGVAAWGAVFAATMMLAGTGCQYEIVHPKGRSFLAGVPGATAGGGGEKPAGFGLRAAATPSGLGSPQSEAKQIPFTIEHEDGSVTLILATGRHLLHHVYQTVLAGDEDLFVEQVLSKSTLEEFSERGVDPREAFRLLKRHEGEVAKLMNVMPAGEFTPGLFLKPLAPGVMRLEANSLQAQGLAWKGVDMEWDRNGWRLRWLVRTN